MLGQRKYTSTLHDTQVTGRQSEFSQQYASFQSSPDKTSNLTQRKVTVLRIHDENIEIADRIEKARHPVEIQTIPEKVGLSVPSNYGMQLDAQTKTS